MAKTLEEITSRRVMRHLRSSGNTEHVKEWLQASATTGEIAVEYDGDAASGTSLWTLSSGGTAVQFVNKDVVAEMIKTGASDELNTVEASVGLQENGTLPSTWKFTGQNIVQALEGLSGNVVTTINEVSGAVKTTIEAMDKSADAKVGQIVTTVSETDGVVSETKKFLKNIVLSGYTKSNSTGAIDDNDTVNEALSKLENQIGLNSITNADGSINVTAGVNSTDINVNIKSGEHVLAKDGSAGVYTDIKLSGVTPSSTNVKEEYVLYGTDGTVLGEHIKVYKDSSLYQVYLGHVDDTITSPSDPTVIPGSGSEALCFIYLKADGTYGLVAVNVESFLQESEFKSGVTADLETHIVHGVVDTASEKDESNVAFLTVGADGFKVSGIKDAIDTKINKLDSDVSGKSADEHVSVEAVEVDGKLTSVSVSTSDIASAQALSGEIAARKAVDGQTGQTYEANTNAHYISAATSLNDADVKIDAVIGVHTGDTSGDTYDVTFSSSNTVADNISDIKKRLEDFKNKLTLNAVDDDKYIATQVTTAETGTTIGISAITKTVSEATSSSTGLADAYDVRTFAVSSVANHGEGIVVDTSGTDKVLDFSNFKLDCGEF